MIWSIAELASPMILELRTMVPSHRERWQKRFLLWFVPIAAMLAYALFRYDGTCEAWDGPPSYQCDHLTYFLMPIGGGGFIWAALAVFWTLVCFIALLFDSVRGLFSSEHSEKNPSEEPN